jgi:hypothetical protein
MADIQALGSDKTKSKIRKIIDGHELNLADLFKTHG